MNKKSVAIWLASIVVFVAALPPFFLFMFKPSLKNLLTALLVVAIGAVLYIIGSKKISHKEYNYTVFQARTFYKQCMSSELTSLKQCKLYSEKMLELAKANKFSQELNIKALWEMYEIGRNFDKEMKG